jgi:hypothetical protein
LGLFCQGIIEVLTHRRMLAGLPGKAPPLVVLRADFSGQAWLRLL